MFYHYLKASLNTFKRFSIQLTLAMFSLIIGLTGAAVLLLYAYQEFSHDDYIPNAENIYRIENTRIRGATSEHDHRVPRPLPSTFKAAFSEVDLMTKFSIREGQIINGVSKIYRQGVGADENFFKIFNLPAIKGALNNYYNRPDAIVLTESLSKTLYGDTDPIGKTLHTNLYPEIPVTVVAVIEDLPNDIHLIGDFFIRLDEKNIAKNNDPTSPDDWSRTSYRVYFTLEVGSSPSQITNKLPQFVEQYVPESFRTDTKMKLNIISVKNIYFHGAKKMPMRPMGNIELVYGFITIAVILIIISSFNFTNLMLAVHSARRKELALRKVAGATQTQLIIHITAEISFLILTGIIVSIGLAQLLLPFFNQVFLVALSQNLIENPIIALGYGAILVIVVFLSSLSPSRMVGNIRPALILTGSELQKKSSKILRNSFLTIQFAIAIALIPIGLVVMSQVNYAEQKDTGFKKEGVIAIQGLNGSGMFDKKDTLIQEIKALPYVKSVSTSLEFPSNNKFSISWSAVILGQPQDVDPVILEVEYVGYDYFRTYDIKILAGRTFSKDIYQDNAFYAAKRKYEKQTNILVNESAVKALGFSSPEDALGQSIKINKIGIEATIIGIIPDINFISLKTVIKPEFYINLQPFHRSASIAYETDDTQAMINDLRAIWKKLGATTPLDYVFVQDNWNKAYADDRMAANIFTVFAMIGVLISLAGIYSVMLFETSKQLREVAIRKVMGGSIKDIMKLLMMKSSIPVIIACFIALPLAWYGLGQWLNGYVDRIALDPLVFIGSGLAMLLISWITVGSHAYKVASTSPAEALRRQ
jgi:putative ABC transport system permease protein